MTNFPPRRNCRVLFFAFAVLLILPVAAARAQAFRDGQSAPVAVQLEGDLTGFRKEDAAQYLSAAMNGAGVAGWNFQVASGAAAADRVVWMVQLDPYAGGGVRTFFPIPGQQKLFGPHRQISVELRLYLAGQYQAAVFGQAVIQGGAQDKELGAFIARLSQGLLGVQGAYRAGDTVPDAAAKPAH